MFACRFNKNRRRISVTRTWQERTNRIVSSSLRLKKEVPVDNHSGNGTKENEYIRFY